MLFIHLCCVSLFLCPSSRAAAAFMTSGTSDKPITSRLPISRSRRGTFQDTMTLKASDRDQTESSRIPVYNLSRRRTLSVGLAISSGLLPRYSNGPSVASASDKPAIGSSAEHPVAVLGANGRLGIEMVQALAKEGMYTVTMTRTGKDPFQTVKLQPEMKSYIFHYADPVDVTDKETVIKSLKTMQVSGIVYCASASAQGGTAQQVDCDGVTYAAEAARELGARLVNVSALAVDRPNSKAYQVTNALGGNLNGMMDAKLQGENNVREILRGDKNYVIIRPGVLMNGKTRNGPIDMEVNQGDTIGGGLSRDELAGVIVGALMSGKAGATVEVYRRSTAMPLQPSFDLPSGKEKVSDSYAGLFTSLERDTYF